MARLKRFAHYSFPAALASSVLTACLAGCGRVNPRPDYARATDIVAEQTGFEPIYNPELDDQIARMVDELFTDGLTTDEAVRIALLNNPNFQALFHDIGASRADVVQSRLITNPTAALAAEFPDAGGRAKLTFSWAQQIAELWQIPARSRIAEQKLEQVIYNAALQAEAIAAEVRTRYWRVVGWEESARLTNENLEIAQRMLELGQRQLEAGEVGALDVALLQTGVLDVQLELLNIQRDRELALADLRASLGLSCQKREWRLIDQLPEPATLALADEDLIRAAFQNRLDICIAAAKVNAAEADVRLQEARIFSDVAPGLGFERIEQRSGAIPTRTPLADTLRDSIAAGQLTAPTLQSRAQRQAEKSTLENTVLGPALAASIPIWDQNLAQIAKARFLLARNINEYENTLITVVEDVRRAAATARVAASITLLNNTEVLPLALQNVEASERLYEAGEQTVLTLLQAQQNVIARRRTYVTALRDYSIAMADLERAVGARLPKEELEPEPQPPGFEPVPASPQTQPTPAHSQSQPTE
jgi:cobalt-zinc-cadmium efflux system outer membrane protein